MQNRLICGLLQGEFGDPHRGNTSVKLYAEILSVKTNGCPATEEELSEFLAAHKSPIFNFLFLCDGLIVVKEGYRNLFIRKWEQFTVQPAATVKSTGIDKRTLATV